MLCDRVTASKFDVVCYLKVICSEMTWKIDTYFTYVTGGMPQVSPKTIRMAQLNTNGCPKQCDSEQKGNTKNLMWFFSLCLSYCDMSARFLWSSSLFNSLFFLSQAPELITTFDEHRVSPNFKFGVLCQKDRQVRTDALLQNAMHFYKKWLKYGSIS